VNWTLDTLDEKQVVLLQWVKAHVGLTRNEKADLLANRGSKWYQLHWRHCFWCPHANLPETSRLKLKKDGSFNVLG
jgi:hypothetical protein